MMVPSHCLASNLWRCNHFSLLFFTTPLGSIKLNRFHPGPEFLRVCKIYADSIYLCVHMHVYMLEVFEIQNALSLVFAISFGTCEDLLSNLLLISIDLLFAVVEHASLTASKARHLGTPDVSSVAWGYEEPTWCFRDTHAQNIDAIRWRYLCMSKQRCVHICVFSCMHKYVYYGFVYTYVYNHAYWYNIGIICIYIHTVYCTCTVCTALILLHRIDMRTHLDIR